MDITKKTVFTRVRSNHVLLAVILALGFALRLSQPTLVEFKRDEATIVRVGQAIAREGFLPAVGVDSSLGIDNLPLTLYLAALPLLLSPDPLAVVVFTALLNSFALVACYLMVREMFGERVALLSTLLFAVSPWAVLYARKIWARTLPLFTVVLIGALYLALVRRRPWAMVPAWVALAALLGLQLEALAFIPLVVVVVALNFRAVRFRPLLVGGLAFGLLLAPYAWHDFQQGWENLRGLLGYVGGDGSVSLDAVRYALMLPGSQGIEGQAGALYRDFRSSLPPLWWLNTVLAGLLVAGVLYGLHQAFWAPTESRRRTFALLLVWFAVPIALQLKPSAPTQLHYYVMHYPVQFIFIAVVLVDAVTHLHARWGAGRRMRWVVGTLLVMLGLACGWQVMVTARLRAYMIAHPSTGGYGIPLRYTRQVARAAALLVESGEVVVLGPETRPFMAENPTVFDALLFETPHRFADVRSTLLFPERARVVYVAGPTWEGVPVGDEVLARLGGYPSVTSGPDLRLPDGTTYRLWLWQGVDRSELLDGLQVWAAGVPFANNVVVAAHGMKAEARPGEAVAVWLGWWLRAAPPEADYHFTVQILDVEGRLRSQDDHAGFPSDTWQMGDFVLSRFVLPLSQDLAPGAYEVRAGLYSYPQIEVVPIVDLQGEPAGASVLLGSLRVIE